MSEFTVTTILGVEKIGGKTAIQQTELILDFSEDLDADQYINKNLPNQAGCKAITNVLIQGLIANAHVCHNRGFLEVKSHMEYILEQLEIGCNKEATIRGEIIKKQP
jgi:hypothetical protein